MTAPSRPTSSRTPLTPREQQLLSRVWELHSYTDRGAERSYLTPSQWVREMLRRNHERRGLTVAERNTIQGFIDHPQPAPSVDIVERLAHCFPPHKQRTRPYFLAYARHILADATASQVPDLAAIEDRINHYRSQPVTVPDPAQLTHTPTGI